jgi:hypothetical protein
MNKPLRGIIHVYCRINGFFLPLHETLFRLCAGNTDPRLEAGLRQVGNAFATLTPTSLALLQTFYYFLNHSLPYLLSFFPSASSPSRYSQLFGALIRKRFVVHGFE